MNVRLSFRALALVAALLAVFSTGCSKEAKVARHFKRAEAYFKKDQLERAKIEYLNVLRLDRTNAVTIQRLGQVMFDQGAPLQAYPFLVKARDLFPMDTDSRLRLAYVFLAAREHAKARLEALTILSSAPTNDEAILLLADASLKPEEIADARQRLQAIQQRIGDRAAFHMVAASWHVREKDLPKAEIEARRAIELDPRFRWARMSLAGLLWAKTNVAQADQEFRVAAELSPLRSVAVVRHADFKAQTGSMEEARKILQDHIAKVPDYLPPRVLLAQFALAERKLDEAGELAENILRVDPSNLEIRMLLSQVWLGKGQTARAVQEIETMDRIFPKAPQTKLHLALAYLRDGKLAPARASVAQAIALNPEFAEAVIFDAELDLRQGEARKAASSLIELLKKRPELLRAHQLLADAYLALARPDDALAIHQNLVKANPKNPQLYFVLGVVLREQKKLAEARAAFDKAWELGPGNPLPLFQLVELDLGEQKYGQAMARVQAYVQKHPDAANAYFLEGRVHAAQTNWNGAEAALQKTLDLDSNFVSAYYALASLYSQSARQSNAIAQLENLIVKRPKEQRALMLLGMLQDERKEFAKARDTYERVLKVNPSFLPALNNLAYLYAERLGQLDKAYELARKARSLQPDDPTIADTLGWILYRRNEFAEALPLLRQSVEKLPGNPEIQFHLGMTYYQMGQELPATAALRQAAESSVAFLGREVAQQRLAMLSSAATGSDSIALLEKAIRERPADVIARTRLAALYQRQGMFDQAAKTYMEVLDINPKSIAALTHLAELHAGPLQNQTRAMEYARKARENAPGDVEVAALLGRIAFESGDHAWAYGLLQESARVLTNRAEVFHDFAWALYSLGRESEAVATMQRALATNPRFPAASSAKDFLAMISLLHSIKSLPDSQRQAGEVLKNHPNHVPALMVLVAVQQKLGDGKAAIQTCERALARFPEFVPAQKQMAILLTSQPGSEERAYQLAIKARQALPEDFELARLLGRLSCQRKDFPNAIRWLQQVTASNPDDGESLYFLGVAFGATKEPAKSKDALERSLAKGLQEPFASEARRLLAARQTP